jgi:hypothetical protein
MLFNFSTQVLIKHLWQLKTVVYLHWCLISVVLLQLKKALFDRFLIENFVISWLNLLRRFRLVGATTSSIKTLSITTLSILTPRIKTYLVTFRILTLTQLNNNLPLCGVSSCWVSRFFIFMLNVIMQNVIRLSVVAPVCR